MNTEQFNKTIERKNKLFERGVKQLREINDIARALEQVDTLKGDDVVVQFCKLAGYKIRLLSYLWVDMDDECKYIPAPPTEEEIAEAREEAGDD